MKCTSIPPTSPLKPPGYLEVPKLTLPSLLPPPLPAFLSGSVLSPAMTLKKLNFCPSPCLLWAADLARQACPCHCLFACTSRPRRGSQGGTPPPPPALAPSRRVTHQLVQTYFTLSQTAPPRSQCCVCMCVLSVPTSGPLHGCSLR